MSKSIAVRRVLVSRPFLFRVWPLHRRCIASGTTRRAFIADMNAEDIASTAVIGGRAVNSTWSSKMVAWQAHSYGTLDDLVLTSNARSPALVGPKEVLVRVAASSVNPLDVLMTEGYGQVLLGRIRQVQQKSLHQPVEFPLTLGRDFTGEVVATGVNVTKDLKVGDTVVGVVPPFHQGCHAEFVSVPDSLVAKKPAHMNNEEAAGLLYTGLTVWSALKVAGGLYVLNAANKNILVIGGSGGVGNCAIQLLKSWGAKVTTTCHSNAMNLVKGLGPDNVIDYTAENSFSQLKEHGKYDLILDAAGIPYDDISTYTPLLKGWTCSGFITLRSPILHNLDSFGLLGGMMKNAFDLVVPNILSGALFKGSTIRWGAFMPLEGGVNELVRLAEEKKMSVPIDSVYKFMDLKDAYRRVQEGHLRGKVVITFDKASLDKARLTN